MTRIYNYINDKCTGQTVYSNKLQYKSESFSASELPTKVDLRSKMPPIMDQYSVGSCTACSVSAVFQFCDPTWDPSVLFLYYNTRMLDGTASVDAGTSLSQTVNSIYKFGVCNTDKWPYLIDKWSTKPSLNCYQEGLEHQTISYSHVQQTGLQMKACLANGFPFVFGFMVYASFESSETARTGIVTIPNPNEQLLGGHAVVCVGYDDSTQMYICRNSWGTNWGDAGYFYMPYAYLESSSYLASDCWKITQVEIDGETPTPIEPVNPVDPPVVPVVPVEPPVPGKSRMKIVPKYKDQIVESDVTIAKYKQSLIPTFDSLSINETDNQNK